MEGKKTKILYILTKPDLGGVSKYLLEIVSQLPQNIEPYFIMSEAGYFSEELEKLGLKDNIFFVPMTNSIVNIPLHIKSNLQTLGIINKIKPDLIHCNSTTGGIVGRICGALTFNPVIFTAHGWAFTDGISKNKQRFYKILETLLAFLTKKIICVSEYDRQLALKVMPFFKNKLVTIHNGIADTKDEYKKKEFSQDKLKVVMIARFCPQKDPYTLINAVNELNKEGLNIELDLYGYGQELQQVLDLIRDCNCSNIQYKGEISDVTPILKDYDVYSLITNWEGLPIGIIEAMRAGLPVLVSNVGGCAELVQDNGYLVEKRNVEDLKSKLKSLYENIDSLPQLGQNSRTLYEKEFTAEKMVEETVKGYFPRKIIIEDGLNLYKKTGQGQYGQNMFNILVELGYNVEMKRKPFLEKIKNSTIKRILYVLWLNSIFPLEMFFKDSEKIIFTNTITPIYKIPGKQYYPVLHDLWAYKSPDTVTLAQKIYTKVVIFSIRHTYKKIITVSETIKKEIIEFFNCSEDDVKVIYNYFSFGENPVINYPEDKQIRILNKYNIKSKTYILSVATLNKRKNIPMLIDAYNQLDTDMKLVLVGGASSEKFNCNNPNIIFTGYIEDEELKVLYKHAKLYVFPSVYEGFGIPIIDAQAFGIPVICSNIPIFKEIAGEAAIYSEININAIKTNILFLLKNEEEIIKIIDMGFKNTSNYKKSIIKKQLMAICKC